MKIEIVAPNVHRLVLWPFDAINAYVLGDILVDSGGVLAKKKLLPLISGFTLRGHALTHAHFDHQGCSHVVCERFGIPLMCGEGDRTAVEAGDSALVMPNPNSRLGGLARRLSGPGHPVARALREGDEVGGFVVIETPGHTPGHLAFWREEDRVLVLGDVLFHRNPMTLKKGLTEPFHFATYDSGMNRASAKKLADLEPATICFGHGAPLRDTERFTAFVSRLSRA